MMSSENRAHFSASCSRVRFRSLEGILILIGCYFVLNIAVRLFLPGALELDEAEQVFFSQWMALGYGPQPPFYNWLANSVFATFGLSLLSMTALKNALLFFSYVLYGLGARRVLRDERLVVMAVLGLLTLPQVAVYAQRDLSHTVAVIFATCLFFHALVSTLERPSALSYAMTGVAIGIGMICKYNFALLPAAVLIVAGFDRSMRPRLTDRRMALTVALALIIVLPHAVWLSAHLHEATQSTLRKMNDGQAAGILLRIKGVASLLLSIASFCALAFVVFLAVFGRSMIGALRARNKWTVFLERTAIVCFILLLIVIVLTGATKINERWLAPFLLYFPLYLCLKAEAAGLEAAKPLRRLLPVAIVIMALVPAVLLGRVVLAGRIGDYEKLNIPYEAFVARMTAAGPYSVVIAEDRHLAGNLHLQMRDVPVEAASHPAFQLRVTITDEKPALVVWRDEDGTRAAMPPRLKEVVAQRLGYDIGAVLSNTLSVPYAYAFKSSDAYRFGYALVEPKAAP